MVGAGAGDLPPKKELVGAGPDLGLASAGVEGVGGVKAGSDGEGPGMVTDGGLRLKAGRLNGVFSFSLSDGVGC